MQVSLHPPQMHARQVRSLRLSTGSIDALVGYQIKDDLAVWTGCESPYVRAGCGPIMSAGYLQNVFTSLFRGHAEFAFGRPSLYPGHGGRGPKAMLHSFPVENDADFDMAAPVQMRLYAMGTHAFANDDELVNRLIGVLNEEDRFRRKTVLLNKKGLDRTKIVFGGHLQVLNFAASFDLVENVDRFHGSHSLGGDMSSWPYCPSLSLTLLIAGSERTRKAQFRFLLREGQSTMRSRRTNEKVRTARAGDGINVSREMSAGNVGQHPVALRTPIVQHCRGDCDQFDHLIGQMYCLHGVAVSKLCLAGEVVQGVFESTILIASFISSVDTPKDNRAIRKLCKFIWLHHDTPTRHINRYRFGFTETTPRSGADECYH